MNDYLKKYGYFPDLEVIERALNSLQSNLDGWDTPTVLKNAISFIDLTSLNSTDTESSIKKLIGKVNGYPKQFPDYPLPAAVCLYPNYAKVARESLEGTDIALAVVAAGFPSSQMKRELKLIECIQAVKDGVDEIDIVLNLSLFFDEKYEECVQEIKDIKSEIGAVKLKVILETGVLVTPENIAIASFLAMEGGADFIKTSTGKLEPAATPLALYVMSEAIKKYHETTRIKIGIKAAGGIKSVGDILSFYAIIQNILGKDWLNPMLFRFGTSKIYNKILSELEQKTINYF